MKQISLFYAENVLKMRKSANYADPHHRILSDARMYMQMYNYVGLLLTEGSFRMKTFIVTFLLYNFYLGKILM